MESIIGDIRDLDLLQATFDRVQPEIVLHLAAQPIVQVAYEDPVETFSTNMMGTVNVLECARRTASVRSIVVVTSDKCYANRRVALGLPREVAARRPRPLRREQELRRAHRALLSRVVLQSESRAASRPPSWPRCAPATSSAAATGRRYRLVPDIIATLREDRPLVLRHPKAIRPWQHVLEPLRGYLQVAENLYNGDLQSAGPWNFGPVDEDCLPVAWLAKELSRKWGREAQWETDRIPHPHEDTFLKLDCSKARAILGWAPVLRLSDGLQWIADWYQAMDRGENMRAVTIAQIESYRELAAVRSNRTLNAAV